MLLFVIVMSLLDSPFNNFQLITFIKNYYLTNQFNLNRNSTLIFNKHFKLYLILSYKTIIQL